MKLWEGPDKLARATSHTFTVTGVDVGNNKTLHVHLVSQTKGSQKPQVCLGSLEVNDQGFGRLGI